MGVGRFPDLMTKLIAHGRGADTPVAIVENGSTPDQRVIRGTLGQLVLLAEAHRVAAPAILIIGDVARRGDRPVSQLDSIQASASANLQSESAIQTG